ncbi:hypothetical protein [Krasilnikovia sp. MM14-A1259]|uniref:hypothetical protein n=1 Tax=Krasilnikovia sp. MM14-A1259 TaxID=3373539 RepID=UPI00381924FD
MSARIPNDTLAAVTPSRSESLLDAIDYRFRLAGQGPQPLSVDGRALGHGLPRRPIALVELSSILMHPSCSPEAADAAWRLLVAGARTGAERWIVGAVGVALPGLRRRAHHLWKLSAGDVDAALIAQFMQALTSVDIAKPGVVTRLLNTAFSKARSELDKREPASGQVAFVPESRVQTTGLNHPDFVLARAVRADVITAAEADVIGATYLEATSVGEYAERVGRSYWQVYRQRGAAVQRLVAAIRSGDLDDDFANVVAEATTTTALEAACS